MQRGEKAMSATKATISCMLAILLVSCGQVVKERLTTPATGLDQQSACATSKTIVVLPFADYASADALSCFLLQTMHLQMATLKHLSNAI